jgi:hypothetical protein
MEYQPPEPPAPVHLTDLQIEHGYTHEDYFGTEDWRRQTVAMIEQKLMMLPAAPLA